MHLVCALKTSRAHSADTSQNDQISISHKHQDEDGLPNLEDIIANDTVQADDASTSSVVHTPPRTGAKDQTQTVLFSPEVRQGIQALQNLTIVGPLPAYLACGGC
jgi:hypothetical protein